MSITATIKGIEVAIDINNLRTSLRTGTKVEEITVPIYILPAILHLAITSIVNSFILTGYPL